MNDFTTWMQTVDAMLIRKYDMDSTLLEDYSWWDEWDSGSTPFEAVEEAEHHWGVQ